jgi:AAHS family 4-hydroxybenzoate transporter-like MFS transporter
MQELALDVRRFIDEQPFSRYQLLIVSLFVAVVVVEGFDAQAMAYVAPAVSKQLHISRDALGPVLSSGLVGMVIGALLMGTLGDRIGRRPVIIAAVLLTGLAAFLTATAQSVQSLLVFRAITGLGMGGSLPNLVALNSEYMPHRIRATSIVVAGCGVSLGAIVGAFVSSGLIARFGWQAVFLAGGIVPCAMAILLFALLPESIRFLVNKGGRQQIVAQYLSRIARCAIAPHTQFYVHERGAHGFAVRGLFTAGRGRLTLALWVMFFMNLLDTYLLSNWLPTIMHDTGIKLETAIRVTSLFQGAGALGALVLGRLIDSTSSYRVLAWAYLAAGFFIFLIDKAGTSVALLSFSVAAAGFCVVGAQYSGLALTVESYPTAVRSTGVGWVQGIGRIGSISGPLLGGLVFSAGGSAGRIASAAAAPIVIAAAAAFLAANAQVAVQKTSAAMVDGR